MKPETWYLQEPGLGPMDMTASVVRAMEGRGGEGLYCGLLLPSAAGAGPAPGPQTPWFCGSAVSERWAQAGVAGPILPLSKASVNQAVRGLGLVLAVCIRAHIRVVYWPGWLCSCNRIRPVRLTRGHGSSSQGSPGHGPDKVGACCPCGDSAGSRKGAGREAPPPPWSQGPECSAWTGRTPTRGSARRACQLCPPVLLFPRQAFLLLLPQPNLPYPL